ncbi:tRNA (adenosine(37)-N6)-threonylcarbamoyltransferase complex transferase subunit TsaD [Alloprevotella sp. OH1205_COT-284]|uniref:tRNA (adenosine(37)-N6)-threonylcarbamoyltransferase complex transferase subunit TsaD n=1 Tax=Alloprevotella sp. OH1205_COT-284 TaxID=2491043 RepID=UPI000F5D646C|nr:tRNA (adenosine(37)-N6)-threonylcarbamoyltransferase complex transferase subunit TsaD [Alloprevotella sp. OH1205_COT-284]RRD80429.1 tRNA (adenosine(37)-N6)-threonylcarbamoyltransferase complex transferase subunit TsaD [Alloprevotella sp. OH1205_COT-284]
MKPTILLAIESSCDDTSAAVMRNGILLSNVTASQSVHEMYGGVVPELASRAHQQNIVPVVDAALKQANVTKEELSAITVTLGPGLMGSLLVGVSFAKGLAASLRIPLIEANHLHGHILAHFIHTEDEQHDDPPYPFLCLLVSGGNSQIVKVNAYNDFEILGQTIDDAAGEAIDKCSKVMGLGYPGGPIIDRLARKGNPKAFEFSKPNIAGFDYSFSGLKTSFLYFLRDKMAENPNFIEENKNDLAASLEATIVDILMKKLIQASKATGIRHVALSGGVSANTALRNAFKAMEERNIWKIYIPKFSYTTDNAAMIAITGHYRYLDGEYCSLDKPAFSRTVF